MPRVGVPTGAWYSRLTHSTFFFFFFIISFFDNLVNNGQVYLDTEGSFSASRLRSIAMARFPGECSQPGALERFLSSVAVVRVHSMESLLEHLARLEDHLVEHPSGFVVLDSIAALARRDFDSASMQARQDALAQVACRLKRIAEDFSLPALVTNQVTTSWATEGGDDPALPLASSGIASASGEDPGSGSTATVNSAGGSGNEMGLEGGNRAGSGNQHGYGNGNAGGGVGGVQGGSGGAWSGGPGVITPALGVMWAHAVNTRLVLNPTSLRGGNLRLAKSPLSVTTEVAFLLTERGFEQVPANREQLAGPAGGAPGSADRGAPSPAFALPPGPGTMQSRNVFAEQFADVVAAKRMQSYQQL